MIGNGILKVYKMIGNASLHNLCDDVLLFGMAPTKTHWYIKKFFIYTCMQLEWK